MIRCWDFNEKTTDHFPRGLGGEVACPLQDRVQHLWISQMSARFCGFHLTKPTKTMCFCFLNVFGRSRYIYIYVYIIYTVYIIYPIGSMYGIFTYMLHVP